MTAELRLAVLLDDLGKLLPAKAHEGPLHALPAAIAAVGRLKLVREGHVPLRKQGQHDVPQALPFGQPPGEVRDGLCLGHDIVHVFGGAVGQGLDEQAAGAQYLARQGLQPDAQIHQAGLLLGGSEVLGKILRHLAGNEVAHAHVGLLQRQVPDHGELSISAHVAAHVQLAVVLGGQLTARVPGAALHEGALAAHAHQVTPGAAAGEDGGHGVGIVLELAGHHGHHEELPPQCGGGRAAEAMDALSLRHQLPAGDGGEANGAVFQKSLQDRIVHVHSFRAVN